MSSEIFFEVPQHDNNTTKRGDISKVVETEVVDDFLFDLGFVNDLNGRSSVRLTGKFPVLRSKFKRESLSSEDINKCKTLLTDWATKFFQMDLQPQFFEEHIITSLLFTAYGNPFHPIGSRQLELATRLIFWLWVFDDIMELAIEKKVLFKTIDIGLDQLIRVITHNQQNFKDVQGFAAFRPLFNSFLDIHKTFIAEIPGYKANLTHFLFYLRQYFQAFRTFAIREIDKDFSDETFTYFRDIFTFGYAIIELYAILDGIVLNDVIFYSPSFRQVISLLSFSILAQNDIFGLKKEVNRSESDNLIIFKVIQKGIPLDRAVDDVINKLRTNYIDYFLLRDTLLQEFNNDEMLVKYIHIAQAFCQGGIQFYAESKRHEADGRIEQI